MRKKSFLKRLLGSEVTLVYLEDKDAWGHLLFDDNPDYERDLYVGAREGFSLESMTTGIINTGLRFAVKGDEPVIIHIQSEEHLAIYNPILKVYPGVYSELSLEVHNPTNKTITFQQSHTFVNLLLPSEVVSVEEASV
jgi:hypothetical protein